MYDSAGALAHTSSLDCLTRLPMFWHALLTARVPCGAALCAYRAALRACRLRVVYVPQVRYDGSILKRCSEGAWANATKAGFLAGRWHHDRCGRRLKAFIYLSEVHGAAATRRLSPTVSAMHACALPHPQSAAPTHS